MEQLHLIQILRLDKLCRIFANPSCESFQIIFIGSPQVLPLRRNLVTLKKFTIRNDCCIEHSLLVIFENLDQSISEAEWKLRFGAGSATVLLECFLCIREMICLQMK